MSEIWVADIARIIKTQCGQQTQRDPRDKSYTSLQQRHPSSAKTAVDYLR